MIWVIPYHMNETEDFDGYLIGTINNINWLWYNRC
jgi:hypothetical protein